MPKIIILVCFEFVLKIIDIILDKLWILDAILKKIFLIISHFVMIILGLFFFSSNYISYIRLIKTMTITYVFCFTFFFYVFIGLLNFLVKFFEKSEATFESKKTEDFIYIVSKNILENFIILVPLQFYFIENDMYVFIFIILFSMITCYMDGKFLGKINKKNIFVAGIKSIFLFFILIGSYNIFVFLLYITFLFLIDKFYTMGEKVNYV
jgi:hypothetical protein